MRVRNAWEDSQTRREREAIYTYLTAVFDLVAWWTTKKVPLSGLARRCGRSAQTKSAKESGHYQVFNQAAEDRTHYFGQAI